MANEDGIESKIGWMNVIMQSYAARKEVKPAMDILNAFIDSSLDTMQKHTPATVREKKDLLGVHDFVFCLRQLGETREMLTKFTVLWEKMKAGGVVPYIGVTNTFLKSYVKLGMMQEAYDCLGIMRMEKTGPNDISYNYLIEGTYRSMAGYVGRQKVSHLIAMMKTENLAPTVATYTTLIDIASKRDESNEVKHWFEEMVNSGIKPDSVTYTTLISTAAKTGDMQTAGKWFIQMRSMKLSPTSMVFNSFISEAAKRDDVDQVNFWMSQMRSAHLQPDVATYTALIDAAGRRGDWSKVRQLVVDMKQEKLTPNAITYNSLISRAAQLSDIKLAKEWYTDMIKARCKPDARTYSLVLHYSTKNKDLAELKWWFTEMKRHGVKMDAFTIDKLGRHDPAFYKASKESKEHTQFEIVDDILATLWK